MAKGGGKLKEEPRGSLEKVQHRRGKSLDPKGRDVCFETTIGDSQRARPWRVAPWWSGRQRESLPPGLCSQGV